MIGYFRNLATVYTTNKTVRVRSPCIAVLNSVLVILVWCSFLMSIRLDIGKVYQSACPVRGVVLSKLKGFASTEHLTDDDLAVDNPQLYQRTWDPPDIVYPAQGGEGETGSFTIVTNIIITPNQTLGTCPEVSSSISRCKNDTACRKGFWSPRTHGVYTGKCANDTGTCEIKGWCPIEFGNFPRGGQRPLLEDVQNFTVMLKNSVEFPECGTYPGRNIPSDMPEEYLKRCQYNKDTDPLCPIFRIGDIVSWSGDDFSRVAVKGGVFGIKISWECYFDFGRTAEDCRPKYDFTRVDDREAGVSKGWNFRSADYYSEDRRTLKKQYGLKILISLEGEGRRFDFFQLVITIGATIGLFALAPLACDFLLDLFNMLSKSKACCCRGIAACHDNSESRVEDEVPSTYNCQNGVNGTNGANGHQTQGISNKGMSTSTMSISNETFKPIATE